MEAAMSSKILVSYCNTNWYNNPKDLDFNIHHYENLK
jgi:hypothetical protein